MKYLTVILLLMLLGDDPPRKTKDTILIQKEQAIEQTKRSRAIMDSLIMEIKSDTTNKK